MTEPLVEYLAVRKAQPVMRDEIVPNAQIDIRLAQVERDDQDPFGQFNADAENIERILHNHLPGGTYNALLRHMLTRTASQFTVSFGRLTDVKLSSGN